MPRVLIVDDSPTLRSVLGQILTDRGWAVETAPDGEQGAMAALARPPDVVVSDLWMPGLSGLQLCQLLRGDAATAGVPVVLVSSAADRRSRFWGQRAGAHAFLDKGDLAQVARVLDGILRDLPAERVSLPLDTVIRRSSIPGRLSVLLDRALFDAVVAGELRALAFAGTDVDALFGGLTRLVTDLLEYGWLALDQRDGERRRVFIHQHESVIGASPGVFTALGIPEDAAEVRVVADALPSTEALFGPPVVNTVSLAGRALGSLIVAPARRTPSRDEENVLALAAREVALPLHAVSLLEESQRLAATDPLTGLANRRHGADALAREIARSERHRHSLIIALIDVDLFKRVNDSCGHAVGDRALCHIATVLRSGLRETDLIARWGGEEFLVILPDTPRMGARVAAERLRAAVARSPLTIDEQPELRLTVSVGLAACAGQGIDRLLDEADRALYRAKTRGRNRVEVDADVT